MQTHSIVVVRLRQLLVCMIMAFSLTPQTFVNAQTPSPPPEEKPFLSGIVQSADATKVANVTVFLIAGDYDKPEKLAETKTGELGKFAFSDPKLIDAVTKHQTYSTLMAIGATGKIGWHTGLYPNRRLDRKITLLELKPFSGTLIDADDTPIEGAIISLKMLIGSPINSSSSNYASLPRGLIPDSVIKTDEQGKFTLPGTQGGAVRFELLREGSSENAINVMGNSGVDAVVKLHRGIAAKGKVKLPAKSTADEFSKDLGKVTLWGSQRFDRTGKKTDKDEATAFFLQQGLSAPIKADLSFGFPNLLEGTYRLRANFEEETKLLLPQKPLDWKVEAGQPPFELSVDQAAVLTGRVLSAKTKKPIAGARVRIGHIIDGGLRISSFPTTDDEGAYSVNVPNGKFAVSATTAPDGFIESPDMHNSELVKERMPKFEVTGDTTAPDILLDSATDVTIEVTDENGKPVEGAFVKVVVPAGYPDGGYDKPIPRTDVNGRFVIRGVADDDTLPIWVRSSDGISEIKTVEPAEFKSPVSIVLSSEGLRFRLTVVDDDDEPIEGAKVSVGTYYRYHSKWIDSGSAISGSAGSGITDSQGNFESGPLWPNPGYDIKVIADGYVQVELDNVGSKENETVDLKTIRLRSSRTSNVAGRVVDDKGQPVADARVFCSGKEYRPISIISNAEGQFLLSGVASDTHFVFVKHGEYRFGGGRVDADGKAEISLNRKSSAPIGIKKLPPSSQQRRKRLAKEVLEKAWSLPVGERNTIRLGMLRAFDRLDPEWGIEKISSGKVRFKPHYLRTSQAQRMDIRKTDEMLEFLKPIPARSGRVLARRFATRLAYSSLESDRAKALQYADFALEKSEPNPLERLEIAQLFSQLGQTERAQAIVDKAIAKLKDVDPLEQRYLFQNLAVAMAPYDFTAAVEYTRKLEEGHPQTFAHADVVLAIVNQDLDKAIAEIENLKGDSNAPNIRDKTRFRIAYRIVDNDPDRAAKLVYACEEEDNRAQALARLAVEIAKTDKEKAWRMISDAMDLISAPGLWTGITGGAGPFAAAVAYQAKLVDHPELNSLVWQVRATSRGSCEKGQERLYATIATARLLALSDRFAAREMLGLVDGRRMEIPRERHSLSLYDQYLQAWLLVDFGRGVSLLEDDLKMFEEDAGKMRHGHIGVFELLAAEPDEQFKILFQQTGLWQLSEDNTLLPW